ncbi:MAG: hypothetical protein SNJ77_02030, partial [Cytophagales bacterium]
MKNNFIPNQTAFTLALCFLCSFKSYSFLNFGKFGNKAFSVKGTENVCAGEIRIYELNFSNFRSITWSVPKEKGGIIALNNVYITNVLFWHNIPEDAIYYYHGRKDYQEVKFNIDVTINGRLYRAESPVDIKNIPGMPNQISNFKVDFIHVKWKNPGSADVTASAKNVASRFFGFLIKSHRQTSDTRPVNISGGDLDHLLIYHQNSRDVIYCNSKIKFELLGASDDLEINWSYMGKGIEIKNFTGKTFEVERFLGVGEYTIYAHVKDACNHSKTIEKTIQVSSTDSISISLNLPFDGYYYLACK